MDIGLCAYAGISVRVCTIKIKQFCRPNVPQKGHYDVVLAKKYKQSKSYNMCTYRVYRVVQKSLGTFEQAMDTTFNWMRNK